MLYVHQQGLFPAWLSILSHYCLGTRPNFQHVLQATTAEMPYQCYVGIGNRCKPKARVSYTMRPPGYDRGGIPFGRTPDSAHMEISVLGRHISRM